MKQNDRLILLGNWAFITETSSNHQYTIFDNQNVMLIEMVGNISNILIYSKGSNLVNNLSKVMCNELPRLFQDCTLQWKAYCMEAHRGTSEEIVWF